MILKSLLFSVFLLIFWSFFINYQPFSVSQHQWQDNIISAENFIFETDNIDNVIVGSSLAARLQMDSLPNYYNLSFGGQSIFDGLNLLRTKKYLPNNVFIEVNVLLRQEDQAFKEILSSHILNTLKSNFSLFRTDKQPLALISERILTPMVGMFFSQIVYRIRNRIKLELGYSRSIIPKNDQKSFFNKMLNMQIEAYSTNIDTVNMNSQFKILSNHVQFLKAKGVNIIFFEMPVNAQLVGLKRALYLRDRVIKEYPNNKFIQLPENIAYYKTGDGVHLTTEESKMYTIYFRNEALKIAKVFAKEL